MTVDEIFAEAIARSTPAERTAYLDEACACDLTMRQRVETLLQAHEAAGDFLGKPAIQCAAEALAGPARSEDTQGEAPGDDGDPEPLDFLTTSDKRGSLGRLGHYEVLEVIGRGGMGTVLRAFDDHLHRVVAIKVMAAQLATNATSRRRFAREAQAAAAVSHDHIVTIHAVEGVAPLPYLVMQFVAGLSLQQRLDRDGPLDLQEILRIGMQTASGLAAAHAQGLVHRDIKPANILLENGVERVKITDFGLARAIADANLTQSGVIAGTPQFMSPEQARGDPVDQRTDLFSLGSVLYAMCSGRAPFRDRNSMSVLKRVCEETPTPIREANSEIPDWLVAIIDKLHAKDPAQRYQSAAEVAALLGRHLAHVQHPSVALLPIGMAGAESAKPRDMTLAGPRPRPHRRRLAGAAAVSLCFVAVLCLTEATGVTNLRAMVVHIYRPEGAPVVEVDDPGGKVSRGPPGPALAPSEIRRFVAHSGGVSAVAFSSDGKRVLSGNGGQFEEGKFRAAPDHSARLWDVESGRELFRLEHKSSVTSVALSPDGRRALTASTDQRVRLWDLETGRELRSFKGHTNVPWSVAYSSDGRHAASGGADESVRLWDLESGKEVHSFRWGTGVPSPTGVPSTVAWCVAFSPDASRIVASGLYYKKQADESRRQYPIRMWDVKSREELRLFEGHTGPVRSVVFSSDGRRLLSGSFDGSVRLWDVETGKQLRIVGKHPCLVEGVALSPDGRRALSAGYEDKAVRLWDVETGTELCAFPHPRETFCVAFSPDGRRALSGCMDGTARLWQLPEPSAEKGAFVLLAAGKERSFGTLADAVQGASDGDTIEIRGNGPFVCGPVKLTHALTIRAAEGFRPVLQFAENLRTNGPLVLEGLELQRVGQKVPQGSEEAIVYAWGSPSLRIVNCRFREHLTLPCVWSNAPSCVLRNCEFLCPLNRAAGLSARYCVIDNCLEAGLGMLELGFDVRPNQPDISVQITHSTLRSSERALLVQLIFVQPDKFAEKDARRVRFDASGTIFDAPSVVVMNEIEPFLASLRPQPEDAKALLLRRLAWRDRGNLYAPGSNLLLWNVPPKGVTREIGPRGLADWKKLWASGDGDAVEGRVKYQGGDLLAKLRSSPEKFTPEDFRLRSDSPGYRAGKDGKNLGADVDLVGPGPAYERWKKTPEYQQWLKDSGQVKK